MPESSLCPQRTESRGMSLLEAFRKVAPLVGVPEVDEVREQAADVLSRRIASVSVRLRFRAEVLEEAGQVLLLRLAQQGPLGIQPGHPSTDDEVDYYILRSLRNNCYSLGRPRAKTCMAPIPLRDHDVPTPPVVELLDLEKALVAADHYVARVLVPRAATSLRRPTERSPFLAVVDDLRAIRDGKRSQADVLARELADSPGSSEKTVRDRLHNRYRLALRRLLLVAREDAASRCFPADFADLVRRAINSLRLCQSQG